MQILKNNLYVTCPLCGSNQYSVRYPATTHESPDTPIEKDFNYFRCTSHYLSQHGDIVKCSQCGMIYNNPQPSSQELVDIYKEVEDPLYLEESEARVRTFKHSLEQIHRIVSPPGRLLDIGCYTGVFIETAATAGWNVEGVELSAWAAKIAKEKNIGPIHNMSMDRLDIPPESFQVITLWDVIEHLAQPSEMLTSIHRLLKPGGILAISTHMVDSLAVRILGKRYPFFMDMHVVHFSRKTTRRILEDNGYEVVSIKSHRRVLRMGYFLEKLYHKVPFGKGIIKWLTSKKCISNLFIQVGLLGLVNIYARKK